MQVIDNNYLKGENFHKNTKSIHDLKSNFDKILPIVKKTLADQLNEQDILQFYPNPPDIPYTHIIGLSLLQEALSIDSEHCFWSKLQTDYTETFFELPHLSNYNHRRKRLATSTEQLARLWGWSLRPDEDTFMMDSIPIPVAHIAREYSTSICRKQFRTAPDKGYSAAFSHYYIGYKTPCSTHPRWVLPLHEAYQSQRA